MEDSLDLTKMGRSAPKEAAPKVDLVPREIQFNISGFVDPETGAVHKGLLVSRIMDADERVRCGQIAAALANSPWHFLPPIEQARFRAMALVSIQIREPPDWFSKWFKLSADLLFPIAEQCELHDQRYLRPGSGPGNSDETRPVILVSSVLSGPAPA